MPIAISALCQVRPDALGGPDRAILSFDLSKRAGSPVIPVVLNESLKCRFLFDTGSNSNLITHSVARQLHLKAKPASSGKETHQTLFGTSARATVISRTQFGRLDARNMSAFVVEDSKFVATMGESIDGIIGADLLANSPVILSFVSRKLAIFSKGPLPLDITEQLRSRTGTGLTYIPIVYNRERGLPLVYLRVNDRVSAAFLLDTGAKITRISRRLCKELKLEIGPSTSYIRAMDGRRATSRVILKELAFGSQVLRNLKVNVLTHEAADDCSLIGMDILGRSELLIDVPGNRLTIQLTDMSR